MGLLIQKPQLGLLLPVALLAGGHFRALSAAVITTAALVLASVLLFGSEIWTAYFHNAAILREAVLENGVGVWHRMVSVFVAVRRLGVGVAAAYGVQAVIALAVAATVAVMWYRDVPAPVKNALLVVGTFLATPYLQDYDLVVGAFVALWLAELFPARMPKPALVAAGLILAAPLAASPLANLTGYEFGPLLIAPAFVIVLRAAVPKAAALAA